ILKRGGDLLEGHLPSSSCASYGKFRRKVGNRDIIDVRWDNQLHRPLHVAGYYLNPQTHYSFSFKKQFYACMKRMTKNSYLITKMDVQLEDFKVHTKRKNCLKAKIMNN
ncbi:hypothetical protein S83_024254, partial [Arachis hypogaea]